MSATVLYSLIFVQIQASKIHFLFQSVKKVIVEVSAEDNFTDLSRSCTDFH